MARSLTVSHTESPSTSPLFNAFLLLAIGWMALAAITSSSADAEVTTPAIIEAP